MGSKAQPLEPWLVDVQVGLEVDPEPGRDGPGSGGFAPADEEPHHRPVQLAESPLVDAELLRRLAHVVDTLHGRSGGGRLLHDEIARGRSGTSRC